MYKLFEYNNLKKMVKQLEEYMEDLGESNVNYLDLGFGCTERDRGYCIICCSMVGESVFEELGINEDELITFFKKGGKDYNIKHVLKLEKKLDEANRKIDNFEYEIEQAILDATMKIEKEAAARWSRGE